jgi:hypothetical protein
MLSRKNVAGCTSVQKISRGIAAANQTTTITITITTCTYTTTIAIKRILTCAFGFDVYHGIEELGDLAVPFVDVDDVLGQPRE